ncbi:MAG TPA: hypothetical protein VN673_01510, partial [Clostridia bacterium]|nr:hypothetical protein [Clostridia bacterium]
GWHAGGQLRAAIAYSAEDDAVLAGDPRSASGWWGRMRAWFWGKLIWPYGCLGRTGWFARGCTRRETVLDLRAVAGTGRMTVCAPGNDSTGAIFTRWFQGGHGTYFTPENCEATFEQMYRDIAAQETSPMLAEPARMEEAYDQ